MLVLCVRILVQRDNITAGSNPLPEERVLLGGRCGRKGELIRFVCRRVQARGPVLNFEDTDLGITGSREYRAVGGVPHELYAKDMLYVARVYAHVHGEVWTYGVDVG